MLWPPPVPAPSRAHTWKAGGSVPCCSGKCAAPSWRLCAQRTGLSPFPRTFPPSGLPPPQAIPRQRWLCPRPWGPNSPEVPEAMVECPAPVPSDPSLPWGSEMPLGLPCPSGSPRCAGAVGQGPHLTCGDSAPGAALSKHPWGGRGGPPKEPSWCWACSSRSAGGTP